MNQHEFLVNTLANTLSGHRNASNTPAPGQFNPRMMAEEIVSRYERGGAKAVEKLLEDWSFTFTYHVLSFFKTVR